MNVPPIHLAVVGKTGRRFIIKADYLDQFSFTAAARPSIWCIFPTNMVPWLYLVGVQLVQMKLSYNKS